MNCRQFESKLGPFLDAELSAERSLAMQRHADACDGCRRAVQEWKMITAAARQLPRATAPPAFEAVLLQRLRAEREKRSIWVRIPTFHPVLSAGALALLVMAVGVSLWLLRPFESESPAPQALYETPSSVAPLADLPEWRGMAIDQPVGLGVMATEPLDAQYVDFLLKGTGGREVIVRMPRTIRYQVPPNSDQYYVRNISH